MAGPGQVSNDPATRRFQRVLRMVAELHKHGYQRLRIVPRSAGRGIGIAPRTWITGGTLAEGHDRQAAWYSIADTNRYFGWTDAAEDDARALAAKFVSRFPHLVEAARGRDWQYAGWYAEMLGWAERGRLPYSGEHAEGRETAGRAACLLPAAPSGDDTDVSAYDACPTIDCPVPYNEAIRVVHSARQLLARFDRHGTAEHDVTERIFGRFLRTLYVANIVMGDFDGPLFDRGPLPLIFTAGVANVFARAANLLTVRMCLHTLARGHRAVYCGGYPYFDTAYYSGGLRALVDRLEEFCVLARRRQWLDLRDDPDLQTIRPFGPGEGRDTIAASCWPPIYHVRSSPNLPWGPPVGYEPRLETHGDGARTVIWDDTAHARRHRVERIEQWEPRHGFQFRTAEGFDFTFVLLTRSLYDAHVKQLLPQPRELDTDESVQHFFQVSEPNGLEDEVAASAPEN